MQATTVDFRFEWEKYDWAGLPNHVPRNISGASRRHIPTCTKPEGDGALFLFPSPLIYWEQCSPGSLDLYYRERWLGPVSFLRLPLETLMPSSW